jgi:uncharacterized protein (TIGR00369 family)
MSDAARPPAVSLAEMNAFFEQGFKSAAAMPKLTRAEEGSVTIELACGEEQLRPGGFISGPTQMALADHAAYAAIFTRAGITPMALTSNLSINFLRPCQGEVLVAEATIMKFGRASVVVEVDLRAKDAPKPASHAIVTYVMPKRPEA